MKKLPDGSRRPGRFLPLFRDGPLFEMARYLEWPVAIKV